jgi:hypothetical protein
MKLSGDWHDLGAKPDKPHPRYGKPTQLSLEFAEEEGTGYGQGPVERGRQLRRPSHKRDN